MEASTPGPKTRDGTWRGGRREGLEQFQDSRNEHEAGGVGSASRLPVRGLEGKRIGFFLDDAPMNDQSDFLDLNYIHFFE